MFGITLQMSQKIWDINVYDDLDSQKNFDCIHL